MPETRYVLTSRPPIRAFVISAVLSLVGALLLVATLMNAWHSVIGVLAGTLLVLGLVLAVLALLLWRTLATTVRLSPEGYVIEGRAKPQEGDWKDVVRVSQASDGRSVNIYDRAGQKRRLVFTNPSDPLIDDLLADIAARLDSHRGYTNL